MCDKVKCWHDFVGKTGFVSHTKHVAEATQGSTSFMREHINLNFRTKNKKRTLM